MIHFFRFHMPQNIWNVLVFVTNNFMYVCLCEEIFYNCLYVSIHFFRFHIPQNIWNVVVFVTKNFMYGCLYEETFYFIIVYMFRYTFSVFTYTKHTSEMSLFLLQIISCTSVCMKKYCNRSVFTFYTKNVLCADTVWVKHFFYSLFK